MVLNPHSVLAAFLAALEALLGTALLVALFRNARAAGRSEPDRAESMPLLAWTAVVLVGVGLLSWPVHYLLLRSYVPLWPGVMCVQGVSRVGEGSPGPQGLLPAMLEALQVTKPLLVFVAGVWLTLHLADRAARTGPLRRRTTAALGLLSVVAVADAAIESLYLFTPKEDRTLAAGCCSLHDPAGESDASFFASLASPPAPAASWTAADAPAGARPAPTTTTVAHFALAGVLLAGTAAWRRSSRRRTRPPVASLALLAAAAAAVPAGAAFLTRVAAPAMLRRPAHECAHCLLAEAPESWVGVALFLLGVFCVGWAGVAGWLGRDPEDPSASGARVARLLDVGLFAVASAALFAAAGAWLT